MVDTWQVFCINKADRQDPHERISYIGGMDSNGTRWKLSEDQAIAGIKNGQWKFYTSVQGHSVWVVIALHLGREYLKTERDGIRPDNLLSLPTCPPL